MLALHSGPMTSETAAQDRPSGWSTRQTLAAVGVAVVIGGVGGAAIHAATEGSPRFPGGGPHNVSAMRGGPPPPPGAPLPPGVPAPPGPTDSSGAGALHSEYVVSDGQGGFVTKLTQIGVVDEVTPANVVVRSDDGYTQMYEFPSSADAASRAVAPNDTVTVEATRSGATMTLNRIGNAPPPPSGN
jgi:hypothetical protein